MAAGQLQPPAGRFEPAAVYVLDRARIEVALEARHRYKYVQPQVQPGPGGKGWQVLSPNCSRSVDPLGGIIEIAWLQPVAGQWHLHAHDHRRRAWVFKLRAATLADALARLVDDPLKEFWQ
ncbi:hypothetical protein KAK06_19550 [Ideonella sp. 4Y11]|uniref:DUF3024 domain-containing protein n=1 Tax=Ideonella aquatica TaxID=2824119 RepID=A0A940YNK6_9BURK|nr:hypothetical protein [Ideonella aquatica]MBQ0961161.1 hypothetical protein [Ideonella aquatica]